jgi:hypothetical protein
MLIILSLAVVFVAFFVWRSIKRGRTFVKSVIFLEALDCGESVEEANMAAATFGRIPESDNRSILRADHIRKTQFSGKQLPVIALARSRGFVE